jgi:uncharacterized Zn-finger protein
MKNYKIDFEEVVTDKICCSGNHLFGDGHPQVWLKIPEETGHINCPYCEKKFKLIDKINN